MLWSLLSIALLELRQIIHGKKLLVIGLLIAGAVVLGYLVARYGNDPGEMGWAPIFIMMMNFLFLHTLVILIPLLFSTSLIREETDEGTLVYLFTRPVPKSLVLLAKFGMTTLVSCLLVAVGMILFYAAFSLPGRSGGGAYAWGARLFAFIEAGWLGVVGYGAVFTLVGLVSRRALIWGIAYGFLSEFLLALVPAVIKKVTLMHYVRSVALSGQNPFGIQELDRLLSLTDTASHAGAAFTILGAAAVFLLLSAAFVSTREFFESRSAEAT